MLALLAFIAGAVTFANANCVDAPEIPDARVKLVRSLLLGENPTADFHLYAEAIAADEHAKFLLYSIAKNSDAPATLYLAASANQEDEKILLVHNLEYYIPRVTRPSITIVSDKAPTAAKTAPSAHPAEPLTFDGCLNTFVISPKRQAVHLNLYAKSESSKTESANDVMFVLLENNFLEPVLELAHTSWRATSGRHGGQTDSVIALLPSATGATEVIWKQFSSMSVGSMVSSGFTQNTLYHWLDKGFVKKDVLSSIELKERLKSAVQLPRCSSITPLRFKDDKMPGPNQPAP
jgi:hypothetical protein